jgi:ATP-binding cassette, subfamily B, bacterial
MRWAAKSHIDPKQCPPVDSLLLHRITRCVRPYWLRAAGVAAAIVACAVLNLAMPWFVKQIVDVAIPRRDLTLLWICCGGMIAGPLVAGLLQIVQKYGAERIGQDVMFDLRTELYQHLHRMPFAFFTERRPGEAVSHVLNDVQGVGGVVSSTLVDVTQNAVVLCSTTAFLIALDWRLALVAVGLLPLFITPTRRVGKIRKALTRRVQAGVGDLTSLLTESLSVSGALLVKLSSAEEVEVQRFRHKADDIRRLTLQQSLVGRWFKLLLGLFEAVAPAIVFAMGGYLVIAGQVPLGTIVAFTVLLKRIYGPASELTGVHVDLMTGYAYFERVFDVLDRKPAIDDHPDAIVLDNVAGRIDFKNLSFGYDASSRALSGIDFTIPAGKTVGIVGPSGAGKTTLVSLLTRLYDPRSGSVAIDGIDVRRVTLASLRRSVAMVTQETFLFNATVLENLRYGKPSVSRSEVVRAAKRAQIHDCIAALPNGYDTMVGERGYRFSAGERQRLSIARAILSDPRIVVLDEATSALDSVVERDVQEALVSLLRGRTNLIIAHRLATIRHADVIMVVERGQVVESGTHDELIARAGLYASLWRVQTRQQRALRRPSRQPDADAGGLALPAASALTTTTPSSDLSGAESNW